MQAAMRFAEEHRDWIEIRYKEAMERQRNRKTYGAEEIRNFTEKLPGAHAPGCFICGVHGRNLWKNHNPEPENALGKLQRSWKPKF